MLEEVFYTITCVVSVDAFDIAASISSVARLLLPHLSERKRYLQGGKMMQNQGLLVVDGLRHGKRLYEGTMVVDMVGRIMSILIPAAEAARKKE